MLSELLPPFGQWAHGESRVQKNIECDPCAKKIFVLSALFVFKKIQYEIRVPHKNIRVIPKATLDFFMGFFDMNVAGRRDYALMTEALLVKPV